MRIYPQDQIDKLIISAKRMTSDNKAGGSVAVDGLKTRQRADRQRPIGIVGFLRKERRRERREPELISINRLA